MKISKECKLWKVCKHKDCVKELKISKGTGTVPLQKDYRR